MLFGFLRRPAICLATSLMWAALTDSSALQPTTDLATLGRQSWGIENGLPQNTVSVLLQSRNGFMWAGTELGLAQFDGVGFRVFDHATSASFPDAEIRCLLDAGDDLWVGTGEGLVRWRNRQSVLLTTRDGLPSNSIRGLARTTDGAIWVWTETGLARWTGQHFQNMALENGFPGGGITSIAADTRGGLWVGTTRGAAVFRDGRWSPKPTGEALKSARHGTNPVTNAGLHTHSSLVAAVQGGDVLISTADGIFLEHKGTVTGLIAEAALPMNNVSFLTRLAEGTVAVVSKNSVMLAQSSASGGRVVGRFAVSQQLPGSRIETIFADRESCLWVGTNRGLARISIVGGTGVVQRFPPTDPLAANAVVALLEDREGDLWVGTETAGMHILRDARIRIVGSSNGLSSDATTAIVEDTQNTVWIGTRDSGLSSITAGPNHDARTAPTNLTTANGLLSNVIQALAASPDGDVWTGTPDGLNRIGSRGITAFTSEDGLPDNSIRSLLAAPDNSVWIGTRRGLAHMVLGRFQTLTRRDGLGSDLVGALARTTDGDLWIATSNGLSRLHPGSPADQRPARLHNYTTADGLSSNIITALQATPDGMLWIGTQSDGLNLWDGTRFVAIRGGSSGQNATHQGPLPAAIHAILQEDQEHLWLTSDGLASDTALTRVDTQALLDCARLRKCNWNASNLTSFTTADGLRSRETSSGSYPTALRSHTGQLWFTTPRGVAVVDPLHVTDNSAPPPVVIEHFAVDDRDIDSRSTNDQDQTSVSRMSINAGALQFQFDYAGLSFAAPQKLRYQYMLENFDHGWTDAGTRRTAYYTNIPPGKYRFRVRATLGDPGFPSPANAGSLSYAQPGAVLSFELLPHYYQTLWFWAVILLLIAGLVLLIFRHRVLRVEREFRAVMAERNRIAREIHDTLAQGYVGISLQLEILGELLRHNRSDAAAKHLAVTQGLVREGLDDARQSIWALRSQDSGEKTLPIRLRRQVEKAQDRNLNADLEVHGAYRALAPDTETEILRIAQEAIQNVKRHAAASRMRVRLEYDERELTLTISDDGKGFVLAAEKKQSKLVAAANAGDGHYGLTGMKERAAVIHGELKIESEPGKGTTVRLNVPAPEASARSRSLSADRAGPESPLPGVTEADRLETVSAAGNKTEMKADKE
jgi:signal transduction histidine kinase/ligand-binding sensor domain-containing protein